MIQRQLKIQKSRLHVSHHSEVLRLQRQLLKMESQLGALQKILSNQASSKDVAIHEAKSERICLPIDGGFQMIRIEDILYCEAMGNYSRVYLVEGSNNDKASSSILLSKTLKATEQLIGNSDVFIRCHQSFLININYVERFSHQNGMFAILTTKKSIPVSRRNKKKVMDACV